jgi:hypothetical protein
LSNHEAVSPLPVYQTKSAAMYAAVVNTTTSPEDDIYEEFSYK